MDRPEGLETRVVRQLAEQAGFDLCGFARAEPIPEEHLVEWLESGMAADMDWMHARLADRLDVRRLIPGAKTVIALAQNYYFPDPPGTDASPVARYARGRDYHHTLIERLRRLRKSLLGLEPSLNTYHAVDTGPVMERIWAARAGLGYVGRNGCLITEAFGSYVLLCTMVIDAEVDTYAAGATQDRCGSCSLCLSSCPTEAIDAHARVDSNLCLSFQTIENAGQVPEPLRPALKGLVFGCDICQEVCPLNDAPVTAGARFQPRAVASLGVVELAALTPEDYARFVPGTPLARAQYDGLRRNALYALGALRDVRGKEVAERLRTDPSEKVREAARWALSRMA